MKHWHPGNYKTVGKNINDIMEIREYRTPLKCPLCGSMLYMDKEVEYVWCSNSGTALEEAEGCGYGVKKTVKLSQTESLELYKTMKSPILPGWLKRLAETVENPTLIANLYGIKPSTLLNYRSRNQIKNKQEVS